MRNWLSIDGPIIRALTTLADVTIINFFTLLLCVPVITAGAALTAMHYTYLKLTKGEEGNVVRQFFSSFKQNFKQATILWLLSLLLFVLMFINFRALFLLGDDIPLAIHAFVIFIALVLFLVWQYIFPLLARFTNSVGGTIKTAAQMALAAFPQTLLMAVILLFVPALLIFLSQRENGTILIFRLLPLALLPGITLPFYFQAYVYRAVFKRFEPAADTEEEA